MLKILRLVHQFLDSLCFCRKHKLFDFIIILSYSVNFFHDSWILYLPLFIILLFEELIFFLLNQYFCPFIFSFGSLNQKICFNETCSPLFSLIFELWIQLIIYHKSLMNCKFTSFSYELTHSLIKVTELWNLCFC